MQRRRWRLISAERVVCSEGRQQPVWPTAALRVLLSDMVDNSLLPVRPDSCPFSRRSGTHDHPHARQFGPPRHFLGDRGTSGLLHPTLKRRQVAPAAVAASGGRAPSSAGASVRPPSPGSAGGSAVAGVSHHAQAGTPALAGATHAAARSGSTHATIPGAAATAAPPASSTRSDG